MKIFFITDVPVYFFFVFFFFFFVCLFVFFFCLFFWVFFFFFFFLVFLFGVHFPLRIADFVLLLMIFRNIVFIISDNKML